jgi:hypothetical protein
MKSIQNQYIDLKEGRMSQANFMRNVRMTLPQYVTNVTSFKDTVRILKNKSILTESAPGRDVELYQKYLNDVTDAMGSGLTYADAITKVAAENEMDEDTLSTMVPEQSVGNKAYADNYNELYEAKDPVEDTIKSYLIKGYSYTEAIKLTAAEQGMDEEVLMSQYPQDTVDIEGYEDKEDDDEFLDMIAKAKKEKEEEEGIKGGFGIQDPLEEANGEFPRDPREMAQVIADEFGKELLSLSGIEREKMAISHAYEKILNSGHPKAKIIARNLAFGYADEDWPMEYISTLNQKLKTPTPEIPMFKGTRDALDSLSIREDQELNEYEHTYRKIDGVCYKIDDEGNRTRVADHYCRYSEDLNEARKKKEKKELHPNQIHPSELRMGIKVELEHTDELDKAKKIALDHLAENPYYYTALKLAGVESPSALKAKAPKAAKKEKAAEAELVDKINAMKPVKGFEKAKASSNKAKKETNSGVKGVSELTHNAKSVRGLQKFAATGGKMKTVKTLKEAQISAALPNEEINNTTKQVLQYVDSDIANPVLKVLSKDIRLQSLRDNRTLLRYMYWEPLPDPAIRALELQFKVEGDTDIDDDTAPREFYILSPKSNAAKNLGSSLEMGANKAGKMDAFKEALEKMVRKAIAETFDGRDNLVNLDENTPKLKPEEQEIVNDILEGLNEGMFDKNKLISYLKKGAITAAVIGSLLASTQLNFNQKKDIVDTVKIEKTVDQDIKDVADARLAISYYQMNKAKADKAAENDFDLQQVIKGINNITSQKAENNKDVLQSFGKNYKSQIEKLIKIN